MMPERPKWEIPIRWPGTIPTMVGKAFYTALGHTEASYIEPLFLQHLLGGIKYALGRKKITSTQKITNETIMSIPLTNANGICS
jgi:type 1 glutamine amidotransferase